MIFMLTQLDERSNKILLSLVREYINTGFPVSSKELYENYDFGLKTASIRSVLNELMNLGWISQLHTSGGRVPTDKAYGFYVEFLKSSLKSMDVRSVGLEKSWRRYFLEKDFDDFVRDFARDIEALCVCSLGEGGATYKSGLDELFENLDIEDVSAFREIAEDFEDIEGRISDLFEKISLKNIDKNVNNYAQVFFGRRGPLVKSDFVSTVFSVYNTSDGTVLLAAIGPKRMNYEKSLKAFKVLDSAINSS